MKLAIPLLFSLLAVGGCFDKEPAHPQQDSSTTAPVERSSTGSESYSPPLPEGGTPNELILNGCEGWVAFRNYVAGTNPQAPPETWGWEQADPDDVTSVSLDAYRCNRFHLGLLERGPIHLLVEAHGNAVFPEQCSADLKGDLELLLILTNIVVDDPQVADLLRSSYGMPVSVASFETSSVDLASTTFQTWSWSHNGSEESSLTVFDSGQTTEYPQIYTRHFYENSGRLTSLEFAPLDDGPVIDHLANGTIQPPLVLAQDTGGTFVGQATWHPVREAVGTFTAYRDYNCTPE